DLYNVTLDGNESIAASGNDGGGAVYLPSGGILVASFTTFSNNSSVTTARSGIWNDGGTVYYINSLLANTGDNCFPVNNASFNNEGGNFETGATCNGTTQNQTITFTGGLGALGVRVLNAASAGVDGALVCVASAQATPNVNVPTYGPGAIIVEDGRFAARDRLTNTCDSGAYEIQTVSPTAGILLSPSALGTLSEASPDTTFQSYTIQLTAQPASNVTVQITPDAEVRIVNGGTSYTQGSPLSLVFTSADFSVPRTITVFAIDDTDVGENDPHPSTITHAVTSGPTAYSGVTAVQTASIRENDVTQLVNMQSVSVSENIGSTSFQLRVTDTNGTLQTATAAYSVTFRVDSITAVEGTDFSLVSTDRTVNIPSGVSVVEIAINITNDTIAELTENFDFVITQVTGGAGIGTASARGEILDDDTINPTVDSQFSILPESLGTGTVGIPLVEQMSASGGTAPYIFFSAATFDTSDEDVDQFIITDDGLLTIQVNTATTLTFTIFAVDSTSPTALVGFREYTVEFTLDGQPSSSSAATAAAAAATAATSTPLSAAEIAATQEQVRRELLGEPRLQIDPDTEVPGAYVQTAPADGATIFNILNRTEEYNIIGRFELP
ncbi:MAG: Calx-beta domain-containing protein, partial [Chloroflexota bacterium]